MLTAWHWATAHRPDATWDYSHEVPAHHALYVEADSAPLYRPEWAVRLAGRPLILQLGVTPERAGAAEWEAYCRGRVQALDAAGLWDQVIAVQVSEELYGRFPTIAPAAICAWLDTTAIPVARRVCGRMVWVLEQTWGPQHPVPAQADVIGIDPYMPAWALRTGRHAEAWAWFVERPITKLAGEGRPVHVVGQAFRATEAGDVWAEAPPAACVRWTRELAGRTRGVVAVSWFAWGSMPGIVGARDLPGVRSALESDRA